MGEVVSDIHLHHDPRVTQRVSARTHIGMCARTAVGECVVRHRVGRNKPLMTVLVGRRRVTSAQVGSRSILTREVRVGASPWWPTQLYGGAHFIPASRQRPLQHGLRSESGI